MRLDSDQRTSLTWWFGIAIVAAETFADIALNRAPDKWILAVAIIFVFGLPGGLALLRLLAAVAGSIGSVGTQQPPADPKNETPPGGVPANGEDHDA